MNWVEDHVLIMFIPFRPFSFVLRFPLRRSLWDSIILDFSGTFFFGFTQNFVRVSRMVYDVHWCTITSHHDHHHHRFIITVRLRVVCTWLPCWREVLLLAYQATREETSAIFPCRLDFTASPTSKSDKQQNNYFFIWFLQFSFIFLCNLPFCLFIAFTFSGPVYFICIVDYICVL